MICRNSGFDWCLRNSSAVEIGEKFCRLIMVKKKGHKYIATTWMFCEMKWNGSTKY